MLSYNKRNILVYLKKTVLNIMMPYILFALIYCFGNNGFKDWFGVLYGSRDSLMEVICATPLWFLPCFFIASVLYETVSRIDNHWLRGVFLFVAGVIGIYLSTSNFKPSIGFPFSLDVSMIGLSLMSAGFLLEKIESQTKNHAFNLSGGGRNSSIFYEQA